MDDVKAVAAWFTEPQDGNPALAEQAPGLSVGLLKLQPLQTPMVPHGPRNPMYETLCDPPYGRFV